MNKTQEALKMAIEVMTERGWYADKRCSDLIQTCKEALAELALEQMAENARELGLDYDEQETQEQQPKVTGFIRTLESIDKNGIETWKLEPFFTLQSLQEHDNEVIERCAKVVEDMIEYKSVIEAIRTLKGKQND